MSSIDELVFEVACPSCGLVHKEGWGVEFDRFMCYLRKDCGSCGYLVFSKMDFMMH